MSKENQRKTVEIGRKRLPLRSLLHGKEIREAAKAIESFRMKMNEQEFLYGAKLYVDWKDYGTADIVARRLETDKEFEDRLERQRIAAEIKKERERKKQLEAERKKAEEEIRRRARAVETIRKMAQENGLTFDELIKSLEKGNGVCL